MQAQLFRHIAHCPQGLRRLLLLRGNGEGQAVDQHVLSGDPVRERRVQDPLGDAAAALPVLRDPVLIQAQAHDRRAVFFAQGQDSRQHLGLPVHGVYDGLSVYRPQPRLDGGGIGGVDLQRKIHHRLQRLDHPAQHGRLVDARQPHVDIKDFGSGVLLLDPPRDDVVDIRFPQRLLEALFPGGIDALADDAHAVKARRAGSGTDTVPVCRFPGKRHPLQGGGQGADKRRCGAAAAAEDAHAQLPRRRQLPCEIFRSHMILAGRGIRQSGIWLEDQGPVGPVAQLLDQRQQLLRAEAAVKAHGIHTESAERQAHGRHGGSEEGSPRGLEGHGHPDREPRVFLRGKNGGLDLIQVAHRFDDHKVSPGPLAADQDFPEYIICFLKAQCTQRLQKLPEWPDIQGDLHVSVTGSHARAAHAALHQLGHAAAAAGSLEAVDAEGVGVQDTASGVHILSVDPGDRLRLRAVPQLRDLPDRQSRRLQHGSHSAVQNDQFTVFHSLFHPFDKHSRQTSNTPRSPGSV